MHKRTKEIMAICCISFGLLLAIPLAINYAQDKTKMPSPSKDATEQTQEREAREEVAKSLAGSLFLDRISVKEADWKLKKAGYFDNDAKRISMLFSRGDISASFSIVEYGSKKEADESFNGLRSYGADVPSNKFGERGDRLLHSNGNFMALRFRQGNYFVQIFSPNQKVAERFAGVILESLPR